MRQTTNLTAVIILLGCAVMWITGCATQRPPSTADAQPLVTCYVCDYNNDLGCVSFHLKKSTPHLTFEGKEYFFCSDDCYQAFLHKPAKYASGPSRKQTH